MFNILKAHLYCDKFDPNQILVNLNWSQRTTSKSLSQPLTQMDKYLTGGFNHKLNHK